MERLEEGTAVAAATSDSSPSSPSSEARSEENHKGQSDGRSPSTREQITPKTSFYDKFFRNHWAGEIIAWVLAAACLVIILTIVLVFKDADINTWKSKITINALVNFVSQIAQTALLVPVASSISQLPWIWFRRPRPLRDVNSFNNASRQPLDALKLLWKMPTWCVALKSYTCMINQKQVPGLSCSQ